MADDEKVTLVTTLITNSGNPEVIRKLRSVELEERRALLMRIRQIEENWDIKKKSG